MPYTVRVLNTGDLMYKYVYLPELGTPAKLHVRSLCFGINFRMYGGPSLNLSCCM